MNHFVDCLIVVNEAPFVVIVGYGTSGAYYIR